jgi:phenylpropionate dioxygenase-like ring-hydroxylating dioxygenase large terminal subunit
MPKLQRIDQLSAPPVEGQNYLVPVVHGQWMSQTGWWPVMGEIHEDAKFFHFRQQHYHLDRRFLAREALADAAVGAPLHAREDVPLSGVEWKRRRCHRADIPFPTYPHAVRELQDALAGAQCPRSPHGGWICPHRRFDLSTVAPKDGVLLCPLHGLRVDAATGLAIPLTQGERDRTLSPF